MPASVDDSTLQAVNTSNVKAVVDLLLLNAISNQQAVQSNAVSHHHVMNGLRESSFGQMVNRMNSLDPLEASAVSRVHRTPAGEAGVDAATVVSLAQQLMKGAQTTPPVTVPPPAAG